MFITNPVALFLQVPALYCVPCENAVCEDCLNAEHAEHPTDSLENIVNQQLAVLQDRVDAAKNRFTIKTYIPFFCPLNVNVR